METETKTTPNAYPTIAISKRIRDRLRIQAALEGRTMRDIAEDAITAHLDDLGTPVPGSQGKKKKQKA